MANRLTIATIAATAVCIVPLLWFACSSPSTRPPVPVAAQAPDARTLDPGFHSVVHPFVESYCVTCHGGPKPKADLDLSSFTTVSAIIKDVPRWTQVLERVKACEMPPDDADKQPAANERSPVVAWLESMHDAEVARTAGDPGTVLARRLSNAEYDYTIRDLAGVDIRPTKEFPVDPANAAGFDNSGESLAMSPALVKKYLDAARLVADHVVFTPDGLHFAPHPVTTFEDRDKYATKRIVDFYKAQGVSIATRLDHTMAQSVDYADYFAAAWRFQHRAALGRRGATLADFAQEAKISPKYLATIWSTVTNPGGDRGPIASIQARWKALPVPSGGREPPALRDGCVGLRDFILKLRSLVRMKFKNLVPNDRIVAAGSQTMVLWQDRQYAENRTTYAGNAPEVDLAEILASDPKMNRPTAAADRAGYEESFRRFCAVFPDAFVIYERARMFLNNPRDIASDLSGHRYLTAGFHSQLGYFRDDRPLYDLLLNVDQQRELDRLWAEFTFITQTPSRQLKDFIWFERAEAPSVMAEASFADFRAADDDLLSETKLKRFAEVYYARVKDTRVALRPEDINRPTPVNYRAPAPGTNVPVPPGYTEFKLADPALAAIRDYFVEMNAKIRSLEKAQRVAEPLQLKALVAFAERASRRPLATAERASLLDFYRSLRAEKLSHEDAIRESIVSVLMSPAFMLRVNLPVSRGALAAGGVQPLSDYELASRLSYFLWSSMPDQELMAHATAGDLHRPAVLVAQARRMMRDSRVRGLATEFGGNWLDIRRFEEHNAVDRERFPAFTNELREAMFEEPIRFTEDLVQRNGSVLDFVYGKYTFVNAVLAQHYGMPAPASPTAWVRIDDAKKYQRGGLLPMAAFLTKNAPGLRTSPVKRGHWVVTKLLGERIPAPPPNVPALPADETKLGDLTLRQTLAQHRADKTCASCHNKFDSFGLVFEGFGPVGELRTTDLAGRPAETSAVFPDGSEGSGLDGLQTYFRTKVEPEFVDNLCRKLLAFAVGRTLLPSDDPLVATMRQKLSAGGNHFDTMIEEIVTSPQFLNQRVSPDVATN
jgi:hypothetical protein